MTERLHDTIHITDLFAEVRRLNTAEVYHIKRGFCLRDASIGMAAHHCIEETVEMSEQVHYGDRAGIVEEAADQLCCLFHVLAKANVTEDELCKVAFAKLAASFTDDPTKIKTTTPGLTRRNRQVA